MKHGTLLLMCGCALLACTTSMRDAAGVGPEVLLEITYDYDSIVYSDLVTVDGDLCLVRPTRRPGREWVRCQEGNAAHLAHIWQQAEEALTPECVSRMGHYVATIRYRGDAIASRPSPGDAECGEGFVEAVEDAFADQFPEYSRLGSWVKRSGPTIQD